MPRRSGRNVLQPNRYLGLTETQVVIPDDGVECRICIANTFSDAEPHVANTFSDAEPFVVRSVVVSV